MTALAADRRKREKFLGPIFDAPVAAATEIFHAAGVCFDASGNIVPASDTAGLKTAGLALEHVNNTGAAGAKTVRIAMGIFAFSSSGGSVLTAADRGRVVYWLDDQTVVKAAGVSNLVEAGTLFDYETDNGTQWYIKLLDQVEITTAVIPAGSITAAKLDFFKSAEQTGTGASQDVAHGLTSIPGLVLVIPTDRTAGVYAVTEGAHDGANVKVTVTTGEKFIVLAFGA